MKIRISDNRRFLVYEDGTPFFYLADTAWELFHRLNREEAEYYLQTRAAQKFTVIQAVALAEENGLNDPNPYGHCSVHDNDPTRPHEAYFEHVDFIVQRAAELGLVIGMLPSWGDKWNCCGAIGPEIFTPENAESYGEFLGNRYKDSPIIWILGGDRAIATPEHRAIIEGMARGIKKGDGGRNLMTYHPPGQHTSAEYVHDCEWLDFNMWQTGHCRDRDNYNSIAADYALVPTKPCLDAEPGYENIPSCLQVGRELLTATDTRKSLYWALFAGAFGHTYGCNEVWQCWNPRHEGRFDPQVTWREALDFEGATQMQHGRTLIETRPFLSRIPDQSLILQGQSNGANHLQSTRDADGSYAMIYFPAPVVATIDLTLLKGENRTFQWFNPLTGAFSEKAEVTGHKSQEFVPPQSENEAHDWVLVIDAD